MPEKEKKPKDPEKCKHKKALLLDDCPQCGFVMGWCDECESEVGKGLGDKKVELI